MVDKVFHVQNADVGATIYMGGTTAFSFSKVVSKDTVEPIGQYNGCRGFMYEALLEYYKGKIYEFRDNKNIKYDLLHLNKLKYLPILTKPYGIKEADLFTFFSKLAALEKEYKWFPASIYKTDFTNTYYSKLSKNYISAIPWLSFILLAIREVNNNINNVSIEDYLKSICTVYTYIQNVSDEDKEKYKKVMNSSNIIYFLYNNVHILNKCISKKELLGLTTGDVHDFGWGNILSGANNIVRDAFANKKSCYRLKCFTPDSKSYKPYRDTIVALAANIKRFEV